MIRQLKRKFGAYTTVRDARYSTVSGADLSFFESVIGAGNLVTNPDDLAPHNIDWTKKFMGQSKLLLKPSSSEEVSAILRHCNDRKLAVVPQSGNTGLVGGSTPCHDEVILSLSKMNKILNFDPDYGILSAEAGVLLQDCQAFAHQNNAELPLDLGARGSCMIGGNLATNAGGINFIRHNSLHANCVGLKAVLPNGHILDDMAGLRKNNTGYDLKHLFIGAEGTLGVITEMAMLCGPLAAHKNLVLVSCNSYQSVLDILRKAKQELGDVLYAFEFIDSEAMKCVQQYSHAGKHYPFNAQFPYYALVEIASSKKPSELKDENNTDKDLERMFEFLDSISGSIIDGVVPQDSKQNQQMWMLREEVANACIAMGYCLKYDVSLSTDSYYKLVEETRKELERTDKMTKEEKDQILICGYLE